jgi:hypothetical protein
LTETAYTGAPAVALILSAKALPSSAAASGTLVVPADVVRDSV